MLLLFCLAVKSAKIVCNSGCAAKVSLEKNMVFYDTLEEAPADSNCFWEE